MLEKLSSKTIDFTDLTSAPTRKLSVKVDLSELSPEFAARVLALSSKEILSLLRNPKYEAIKKQAKVNKLTVSKFVLKELAQSLGHKTSPNKDVPEEQLGLFQERQALPYLTAAGTLSQVGTFRVNKDSPIHRWYPYVEGFSADRIVGLLKSFLPDEKMCVYDPFGGSGTVQALASHLGYSSYYSELNPFMQLVCEVKVNLVQECSKDRAVLNELKKLYAKVDALDLTRAAAKQDTSSFHSVFEGRDYFVEKDLRELLFLQNLPRSEYWRDERVKRFSDFAIYCIAIGCSNMTRRADLRRRRDDEYKGRVVNVKKSYLEKLDQIISDIALLPTNLRKTVRVNDSCLNFIPKFEGKFDLILTSPPYLNGTNYFRNTKIELGLAGLISREADLTGLCTDAVTAGINNVSDRNRAPKKFDFVEKIAKELEKKTYDQRIPKMMRCYFSDMFIAAENYNRYLKSGGYFICDIGDSIFAEVHVPTHTLLEKTFKCAGFDLIESNLLRQRYSLNKQKLGQYELVFRKK